MVFQRCTLFLRLIKILRLKKKSGLWIKVHFFPPFFLPNAEELPSSGVYIKFIEVITGIFTYGMVLLPLKNGCSPLRVNK